MAATITLPVAPVTKPSSLTGQANGAVDPALLVGTPGQAGGPVVWLVEPAAKAWQALTAAAARVGIILKATGRQDSYRPYEAQEALFRARYTTTPIPGASTRTWQGQTWYLRPGMAPAAVPGRSNHGLGLAVDVGEESDGNPATTEPLSTSTLAWLAGAAPKAGFTWELPRDEPWHLHYSGGGSTVANPLTSSSTSTGGDPGGGGQSPTLPGPWWLPWNLLAEGVAGAGHAAGQAANTAIDAGKLGLLTGVRHIAIEVLVAAAGVALIGLGVWSIAHQTGRPIARTISGGLIGGSK